jgi:hypothetical protein
MVNLTAKDSIYFYVSCNALLVQAKGKTTHTRADYVNAVDIGRNRA